MKYVTSLNQMTKISTNISRDARSLGRCSSAVRNVRVNIYGVNSTLLRISQEIEEECKVMSQMSAMLSDGTSAYRRFEETIAKMTGESVSLPSKSDESVDSGNESGNVDFIDGSIWDVIIPNALKFIGNFGAIGGVVSAVATWFTGDGGIKSGISIAKYLSKALGNGAVAISKGGKEGGAYLTGWYSGLDKIDTSSFGKAFKSSLIKQRNQLDPSQATDGASKFRTATRWAGHLLTVAGNGYENYIECQKDGISAGRAVGETIIESAVDIGVGIGATALSTAALAALGVAAPVAVVGIGATAITIGANAVCKWATGAENLGEAAADGLYWLDEKISDFKDNIRKGIRNTITASWRGLCEAFA